MEWLRRGMGGGVTNTVKICPSCCFCVKFCAASDLWKIYHMADIPFSDSDINIAYFLQHKGLGSPSRCSVGTLDSSCTWTSVLVCVSFDWLVCPVSPELNQIYLRHTVASSQWQYASHQLCMRLRYFVFPVYHFPLYTTVCSFFISWSNTSLLILCKLKLTGIRYLFKEFLVKSLGVLVKLKTVKVRFIHNVGRMSILKPYFLISVLLSL